MVLVSMQHTNNIMVAYILMMGPSCEWQSLQAFQDNALGNLTLMWALR